MTDNLSRSPAYADRTGEMVAGYIGGVAGAMLDRVVFRVLPDAAALENGQAQYAPLSPVPLRDAGRLGSLSNLRIETSGYEWLSPWLFAGFNVERGPLGDVRVRCALAQAIERAALAKVVWFGFDQPATSPVPSTLAGFHAKA